MSARRSCILVIVVTTDLQRIQIPPGPLGFEKGAERMPCGSWAGVGLPVLGTPLFLPAAAPGDPDRLAVHQCVGDLCPRLVEVAPEGLPGDADGMGGFFLLEPRKIDEAEGLHLLGEDDNDLVGPPAERAEAAESPRIPDPPAGPGPAPPTAAAPLAMLALVHSIISGADLRPACR